MPTFFSPPMYTPTQCNNTSDSNFLLAVVFSLKKVINYLPTGVFPETLRTPLTFRTTASATQYITLSLQGTVEFLYSRVYREPYPTNPTLIQKKQINDIWIGIGHPENII